MNPSQRGVIASNLAKLPAHRPDNKSANLRTYTQEEASKLMKVSPRTIQTIKQIEREAPEELKRETNENLTQVSSNPIRQMKAIADVREYLKKQASFGRIPTETQRTSKRGIVNEGRPDEAGSTRHIASWLNQFGEIMSHGKKVLSS